MTNRERARVTIPDRLTKRNEIGPGIARLKRLASNTQNADIKREQEGDEDV